MCSNAGGIFFIFLQKKDKMRNIDFNKYQSALIIGNGFDLKVYHFKDIIQDIKNQIKPDLREIERIDFKNIAQSFKDLTNHQILKNYLSYFINKKEEHLNYENLFLKEFVLAMFITCVLSYEVS